MEEKTKVDQWIYNIKNNKYTAPFIFSGIALMAILAFGKSIFDAFYKNKDLETKVQGLNNDIDSIKSSLKTLNFAVVNNKVVPTEKNIFYSKNAAGIVYGNIGDVYNQTKTYNQVKSDKHITESRKPDFVETDHSHDIIIKCPYIPIVHFNNDRLCLAIYTLKSIGKEEANDVNANFSIVFRNKGQLEFGETYFVQNTSVITNYPTDFTFNFFLPKYAVDTLYFFLKVTFTNSIGIRQFPFKVLYRKCNSNSEKFTQLYMGTKEYKDVIGVMLQSQGP